MVGGELEVGYSPSFFGTQNDFGHNTVLDVTVNDVEGHYRRARAADAEVVIDLEDAPWGVRRYQARDLEGHQWQFSQPISSG